MGSFFHNSFSSFKLTRLWSVWKESSSKFKGKNKANGKTDRYRNTHILLPVHKQRATLAKPTLWPLHCGWISKILKNITWNYYNEDFSFEKGNFIISYFISSLEILYISWNFSPCWDHKPCRKPLDVRFQLLKVL